MIYSPYNPRKIFFSEVPEPFILDTCRAISRSYQDSSTYCAENFAWEQAHDLRPMLRRAMIERNVHHIVERHKNVEADSSPNTINNCYHLRVLCNGVVLTISAVQKPGEMVRDALFREQYARSPQRFLFAEEESPPINAKLYAILLHGPDKKRPAFPAFLQIVFPDHKCSSYLGESIDLIRKFPQVEELLQHDLQEAISRPTFSRLRDAVKTEEDL